MNVYATGIDNVPTREEAAEALAVLRAWARRGNSGSRDTLVPVLAGLGVNDSTIYPTFSSTYPAAFEADMMYKASLPDLQNGPSALIKGAHCQIHHVGISNFRLPVNFKTRRGASHALQCSVTGTVSLEADKKGINMSRIMRSFYVHADKNFSFEVMAAALDDYKNDLESVDARIQMRFAYPIEVESLRSGLRGWQYYDFALELAEQGGERKPIMHLDYVYSSTCPCSLELSEHARKTRAQLATPHSQRSVARLSILTDSDAEVIWFEDIVDLCRSAVPTETQVMVKREDEQAFAELNAANPIFVEDAARLFAEALHGDDRVGDFRVVASHQESLHSHDAVSVLTEGPTFAAESLGPRYFDTLFHVG
ncbi:MAG: GTP cyclohydrolase FolE2 [Boseongicola sp.]